MAIGVSSRLRAYLRRKLEKTRKCSAQPSTDVVPAVPTVPAEKNVVATKPRIIKPVVASTPKPRFDEQQDSSLFQKLPLEIRKMIYSYVWQGPHDHMYHESNGRHLHFKNGHWVHTRCVMYQQDDEDSDLIQTQMDMAQQSGVGNMLLWQRRLASTWGQRHWRCEERILYGQPTSIDRTDLGALMVVCKKIHPEVMESFIENHKLIFNDTFSAHRFLVARPGSYSSSISASTPNLIRHLRQVDLTLSVPFHELTPFIAIGRPVTGEAHAQSQDQGQDQNDAVSDQEQKVLLARAENSRLGAIFSALASHPTCLHSLQVSLDVYDRGPWRKIPERALASQLARIPVRRGKSGEVNYIVDLPAALPIRTHYAGLQGLGEDEGYEDEYEENEEDDNVVQEECYDEYQSPRVRTPTSTTPLSLPFHVTRRPPLRYWQFVPGEVERFTWETCHGDKKRNHQHCWIMLSKATSASISNPYLIDFTERG